MAHADPDLLERQFRWRNRWSAWQRRRGEWLLAALAALVLAGLSLWTALPTLQWLANLPLQSLHLWLAMLGLVALVAYGTWGQTRFALQQIDQGWLGATPWSDPQRQRSLHRAVLGWLLQRLLMGAVATISWLALRQSFLPADSGLVALAGVALIGFAVASVVQLSWRRRNARSAIPTRLKASRVDPVATHLRGLDLLHAAWTPAPPRSWRLSLTLALLVLPAGLSFSGGLLALLVIAAVFMLGRGYARYRAICVAAAAWLQVTPLQPLRLLRFLGLRVLRQQLLVLLGLCAMLLTAGFPLLPVILLVLFWALTVVLLMLLAFNFRFAPRRYPLAVMIRLLSLGLAAQAFWPLSLVLWLGFLIHAARQLKRPDLDLH